MVTPHVDEYNEIKREYGLHLQVSGKNTEGENGNVVWTWASQDATVTYYGLSLPMLGTPMSFHN